MKLYFENSKRKRRLLGEFATEQEAVICIQNFLRDHNFTSYYTRTWTNPENETEKIWDVGSHTEFFITSEI